MICHIICRKFNSNPDRVPRPINWKVFEDVHLSVSMVEGVSTVWIAWKHLDHSLRSKLSRTYLLQTYSWRECSYIEFSLPLRKRAENCGSSVFVFVRVCCTRRAFACYPIYLLHIGSVVPESSNISSGIFKIRLQCLYGRLWNCK